jgi:phenylacetic acid degradation operon negative regulatory protein
MTRNSAHCRRHLRRRLTSPAPSGPPSSGCATRAWALDDLAADLRAHLPVLDAALDAPPPEAGPDALRRLVTITNAVFVDLLRDPGPPRELRPPDWPGDELRVLVGRVVVTHGPAAAGHIAHRCGAAG